MMDFLGKLLAARSVAAVVAALTSAVAFWLLPDREYAHASLAVAFSAAGTVAFYMPFSKYVLVSRSPEGVEALFWKVQPIVVVLVCIASATTAAVSGKGTPLLGLAAGVLAASQGWKEFSGEVLRVRQQADRLGALYIHDSVTTLALTFVVLYYLRRAEFLLLASASSSLFWSARTASPARGAADLRQVGAIYRYSFGVVASGSLNALTVGTARAVVVKFSPPGLAGAIQFLLDLLQKALAVFASSVLSSAIPPAREQGVDAVLRPVAWLLLAALLVASLAGVAGVLAFAWYGPAPLPLVPMLGLAVGCALLVWSNRFKSTLCDLPLLCAPESVWLLPLGAALAQGVAVAAAALATGTISALLLGSLALLSGAAISVGTARARRLCSSRYAAVSALLGGVVPLGLAALCLASGAP